MDPSDALHSFRRSLYECLHRRGDALFELADAILTADAAPSPVHLRLQASHRRCSGAAFTLRWTGDGSTLKLCGGCSPAIRSLEAKRPYTPWTRACGPDATRSVAPSAAFIARLNFVRESWTAPVDVRRVRPAQDANEVAAEQVKAFLRRSPEERVAPLFVFDAGYDPVKVQQELEGSPCQILVRLRAGRRFYADPSLTGPPAPHWTATSPRSEDEVRGLKHLARALYYGAHMRGRWLRSGAPPQAWANLHPKVRAHEGRGSRGPLPIVVGTLVLVEVERLPRGERRREPRVLWLWWHGPEGEAPNLGLLWRAYVRRFDLEHTFRFHKNRLWDGQRRGCATPSRQIGGRGWWWPLSLNSGWRGRCGPKATLGAPLRHRPPDTDPGPPRRFGAFGATPHAREAAETCGRSLGRPKGRLSGRAKRYPALKMVA